MESTTQIAGHKTIKDWQDLKDRIRLNFNAKTVWEEAFEFFWHRVDTRYIHPIKTIQEKISKPFAGEGFLIMTILCALIEFSEAFYQGKIYKYLRRGETLTSHEYNISSQLFVDFLTNHKPFREFFSEELAKDFYANVRCGLLHEARTKSLWLIRVDNANLLDLENGKKIINRIKFHQAIESYFSYYKKELLSTKARKQAFIRKMDSLCQK